MTTYATNNPIGSMDPKDLFDNAQNLDFAVNDITKAIWKDRFGRNRPTMWGMEQTFSAQLISQQQRFNNFIQNSGYKIMGEYTAGPLTITDYNQLIRYQDAFWKLTASTNIPFTTTGNDAASWVNDSAHFVSVGDAVLRQELAAPGGAGLIGGQEKPITWDGFAGGADSTGVTASDAAFAAAHGDVYIPEGSYQLSTQPVISANFEASGYAELPTLFNYCPSGAHPDKSNVRIRKYWGRQFFGAAANGNGKYDGTIFSEKGPGWAERDAQVAVASADGLVAIFGNSKSSDTPSYHQSPSCM